MERERNKSICISIKYITNISYLFNRYDCTKDYSSLQRNNLGGVDVNSHVVDVRLLNHLIGHPRCIFLKEPTNLLARGLRVGASAFQPTFRVNVAYQRCIGEKGDFTIGRDLHVALRVMMVSQFLNSHHDSYLPFIR